ncbi:hypothetical protein C0580_01830 [Candidatus Parcubacteria bacterium]|nr:MAG: hypothetical protein C0580_01830 [Candidatus Parcubacteria bacterium]
MKAKILKILLFILLFFPFGVKAVGVSVSPSSLELIYPDEENSELIIRNISLEPITVYIYPDDYKEQIIVNPSEVNLLPDEFGRINLDYNFSQEKKAALTTNISVVSKAVDKRSFNAASGLKIPISININKQVWHWSAPAVFLVFFIGAFLLAMLIQLVFILIRPRRKKHWYDLNFVSHHKKRRFFGK